MAEPPRPLIPLADYTLPALPTEETLRRLLARAREALSKRDDTPFIQQDRLRKTGSAFLDSVVAPPACGPLNREIEAALTGWQAGAHDWMRLVVLPPCDNNDLIRNWAARHGHTLVQPPARSDLLSPGGPATSPVDALDPEGHGTLVIPRLDDWFLRHRDGLDALHALFDWLPTLERPCVIGCDTWAWAFLCKAMNADLILPAPLTTQPFDAACLRDWFLELAREGDTENLVFRLSATGEDVFALDEDDSLESDYFATLASRSNGIPWVAWHLWRRSLRAGLDESDGDSPPQESRIEDEDTLWITDLDKHVLPETRTRTPLLILHALLIHGSLDIDELHAVLPLVGSPAVLSALVQSGVVRFENGRYSCVAMAYAFVRSALEDAGFPMGAI